MGNKFQEILPRNSHQKNAEQIIFFPASQGREKYISMKEALHIALLHTAFGKKRRRSGTIN